MFYEVVTRDKNKVKVKPRQSLESYDVILRWVLLDVTLSWVLLIVRVA